MGAEFQFGKMNRVLGTAVELRECNGEELYI